MKKLLIITLSLFSLNLYSQDNLKHDNYVTDFADIFSDSEEQILNDKIKKFEGETEIEFAIVSVKSLDGRSIEGFTNDLFNKWGVGKKGADNGLMILIAPDEREWRIEVGYGLEAFITDGYSKRVADKFFPPNFKQSNYFAGVNPVVDDFQTKLGNMSWEDRQQMIADRKEQEEKEAAERREAIGNFFMWFFLIAGVIAIIAVSYHFHKKKQKRLKEIRDQINYEKRSGKSKVERFLSMLNRIKKLDPYNGHIDDWQKTHETIANELVILEGVDANLEEAESSSELIDNLIKKPTSEMENIIRIHDDFQEISAFYKNKQTEKSIKTIKNSVKDFIKVNMKSKYAVNFTDEEINKNLAEAQEVNDQIGKGLEVKNIEFLRNRHESALSLISAASSILSNYNNSLNSYHSSEEYINSNIGDVPGLIKKMNKKCKDSDVSGSTRSKAKQAEEKANSYEPDFTQKGVKQSAVKLDDIIDEIKSVIRKAQNDIDDEERRRRKAREKKRRARSSSYGGGIGFGGGGGFSGGGGGGFGGFGGGGSGGGGSSGGW